MERATGTEVYGCGSPHSTDITLNIQTTTGGNFSISTNGKNTVEHLKKLVSKKLKVAKDRICLLHRERQLRDGTLEENGLLDGSRVILLPSVETGLLSQRPENSVMQALESLNDTQVNDFLSGKSPLNLTMRLGDHMMLIQLQLSTLTTSASSIAQHLRNTTAAKNAMRTKSEPKDTPSAHITQQKSSTTVKSDKAKQESQKSVLQQQDIDMLQNVLGLNHKVAEEKSEQPAFNKDKEENDTSNNQLLDLFGAALENEQSPIKSLSNLVSSPIDVTTSEGRETALGTSVKNSLIDLLSCNKLAAMATDAIPSTSAMPDKVAPATSHTPDSSISDDSDSFAEQSSFLAESTIDEYPMENLFNNAVDKGLFNEQDESMMDREISNLATTSHGTRESSTGILPSFQSLNEPLKSKRFQYLLHKTSKFKHPIGQNKQKAFMQSVVNKQKKKISNQIDANPQPSTSRTEPYVTSAKKTLQVNEACMEPATPSTSRQAQFKVPDVPKKPYKIVSTAPTVIDTKSNSQPSTSRTEPFVTSAKKTVQVNEASKELATPSTSKQLHFKVPDVPKKPYKIVSTSPPVIDTKALIEASKNLTQKLKKLSKEVLTNKVDIRPAEEAPRAAKVGPGAVIESMKHHGKGIYSGTFSGTLNPALQDRYGRPKRDISTIIHILNDLLCATPPITISQKESKHSCSSGSDESVKCAGCSQPSCSYGQCDGHLPTTSAKPCTCEHKDCQCNRLDPNACASCEEKSTIGETCKKCVMAKTLAMENSKTKCKLEQLRLVMQQKKQRREARKLKTLPYTTTKTIVPPENQTSIQEEIETIG